MKKQIPVWKAILCGVTAMGIFASGLLLSPLVMTTFSPQAALAEEVSAGEDPTAAGILPSATLHSLSIPVAGLSPADSTKPYAAEGDMLFTRQYAGPSHFYAPVYLPQGAAVVKVVAWGTTDTAGKHWRVRLLRSELNGLAPPICMARVESGGQTGFAKLVDNTIEHPNINNDSNIYYVEVYIEDDIILRAIKILYLY
jgi:hypothetical protein